MSVSEEDLLQGYRDIIWNFGPQQVLGISKQQVIRNQCAGTFSCSLSLCVSIHLLLPPLFHSHLSFSLWAWTFVFVSLWASTKSSLSKGWLFSFVTLVEDGHLHSYQMCRFCIRCPAENDLGPWTLTQVPGIQNLIDPTWIKGPINYDRRGRGTMEDRESWVDSHFQKYVTARIVLALYKEWAVRSDNGNMEND